MLLHCPASMALPKLQTRTLGRTGIDVSLISFGAGPVPALMTDSAALALQRQTLGCALEAGINWFDTAATYGNGASELHLGAALRELGAANRVHVGTKVRLAEGDLNDIRGAVKRSVTASLERLGLSRVTLIQLHNSITAQRGDQPTSISPRDVLGQDGVVRVFEELKSDGLVENYGLTALGDAPSLDEVLCGAPWATAQVCCNLLEPQVALLTLCARLGVGVLAIRVMAGGALAGQPPSQHTRTTKFFPLPIYERDQQIAARLEPLLPAGVSLKETAVRGVIGRPQITTAVIGFTTPTQVKEAAEFAAAGPLPTGLLAALQLAAAAPPHSLMA